MRRPTERLFDGLPIGFRLFFGLVVTLIVCIWAGVGFVIYSTATNPEGVGRFAGRIIGGVAVGAGEGR